ncbi:uncharacterized protein LOC119680009 [Teleopsis dalmanni]|uniref:uncharacterized protein LOC119680009 n=1 Tax=Teleopsis dalmanni TaxID=139649 RepID=UPI0018CD1287|nr:uncharacterized protein LOC119680009 [Teleopsis dalmanni]
MDNTTTQTILRDIQNAFKTVTNNTENIYKIVPNMYNITDIYNHRTLIFKIPDQRNGYSMLYMSRNNLMEPVFPNLSTQYMSDMKKKIHRFKQTIIVNNKDITSGVVIKAGENEPLAIEHTQKNDWSIFGLDGWTGELSSPVNSATNSKNDEYPAVEILNNFTSEDIKVGPDLINESKYSDDPYNLSKMKLEDSNIYIARANDPFGYSTKWEFRNNTANSFVDPNERNKSVERFKRDVIELYSMIKCSTGCDPLIYKGYGCYCGFLGSGIPVNGVDRCCKIHDKCYEQSNCISYLEYFVPYVWKCYRGKPLCAIDHGEWGGPQSCASRLCYCDLRLTRCLKQFTCPRRRAVCRSSTARQLQNLLFAK